MGETVPLGEDFFHAADENMEGYSIQVKKATLYAYQEFADQMNLTLPEKQEDIFRADYVYDLEVTVFNEGNEEGGVDLFNTRLAGPDFRMMVDTTLWELLYPQLGGSYSFGIRSDTQMDFHFPFAIETDFEQKEFDRHFLETQPFELTLSNYPTKKMIHISLE